MILLGVVLTLAAICVLVIGEALFGRRHARAESRPGSDVARRSPDHQRGNAPRVEAPQRGEVER